MGRLILFCHLRFATFLGHFEKYCIKYYKLTIFFVIFARKIQYYVKEIAILPRGNGTDDGLPSQQLRRP